MDLLPEYTNHPPFIVSLHTSWNPPLVKKTQLSGPSCLWQCLDKKMKHSKPNTSQARIMSIILLALKTKEFILPRWMWRLQYNTSIGTSFCIEASVKAQRSSKIRPWNFLRHRPYRPAPHITRTMASRYDPPSPSILFCRSKLDERQTRSTFPTKIGARGLVGWQDVAP